MVTYREKMRLGALIKAHIEANYKDKATQEGIIKLAKDISELLRQENSLVYPSEFLQDCGIKTD